MKRCRWFGLALAFFLLAGAGAAECAAAQPFENSLGVSHHFTLEERQDAKDIAAIRTAGFRLIRYDMDWTMVENQKGRYDFHVFDRLLSQMEGQGVRVLFILDYGNPLYGGKAVRTDEARAAFSRFAAAAAARYKGRSVGWEIWNEPNQEQFWPPRPDVYEYMKLVIDTATAMRAANPEAYIIAPGSARIDFSFLEDCIRLGLLKYVNAVSVHPYRDASPETALADYARLKVLIQKMQPSERQVSLVVSEWGYSAAAFGGDEQAQARYLSRMLLANVYAGIDFTVWYDYRNDGTDGRNYEHNFGWVRQDGTGKPALEAAQVLARQLGGRRFSRRLFSLTEDFALEFVDAKNNSCVVAWTTGDPHEAHIENYGLVSLTQTPQYLKCR